MNNQKPQDISTVLKRLKEEDGIPYERIALELGVVWHTVKAWETKRRSPKKSTRDQIAHLFGRRVL